MAIVRSARSVIRRTTELEAGAADASVSSAPLPLPLCSLTNVAAYRVQEWKDVLDDLGTYSHDTHIFQSNNPPYVHRKGWEWAQALWGFQRLDMIQPQHRAIGIGAGTECPIFWLGERLERVVATDLYGNEKWATLGGHEANPAILEHPQAFCPRPIRREAIEFRVMDGTDLRHFDDGTFDLAWSLSSIEHFGSHARAGDAMREMARVTRKGGVLAVATELLLLDDQSHAEYFTRAELEEHVLRASPDLELIEPIDWSLPPLEYLIDSVVVPTMSDKTRRHVVLHDGHVQWTSVLAFFRKV
jgi:SAM-dependent methyltransferase